MTTIKEKYGELQFAIYDNQKYESDFNAIRKDLELIELNKCQITVIDDSVEIIQSYGIGDTFLIVKDGKPVKLFSIYEFHGSSMEECGHCKCKSLLVYGHEEIKQINLITFEVSSQYTR